jgi:hypothetical protein
MSYLVFVNGLGANYKGNKIYEFIFSSNLEVWGDDWDSEPSNGNPTPPDTEYIKKVGVLNREGIDLELIQNSDFFSMKDGVDKVVALGWERDKDLDKRLVFHFGDTEEVVKNKLYEKDIILEFYKEFENGQKEKKSTRNA